MRQANRETKENQRDKKGKMLLFNKVGKCRVLDKGRKVITDDVMLHGKNIVRNRRVVLLQKCIFYFFDSLKAFHEIFNCKMYFVTYILFQSLTDLT